MSAGTLSPAPQPTVGVTNLLRSESTKLRSVRSTYWTGAVAALATVVLGAVLCARWNRDIVAHPARGVGFDPTLTSLSGLYLAQVAVGALGVLTISSEYTTGMIHATFTAVPQRRLALAAKGLVFACVVLVGGELLSFAAFGVGQALLTGAHAGVSLGQPGVLRATAGGGLYLTAVGLLGFGLGALVRRTAGALAAFFGLLFASSAIADLLPTSWRNQVMEYMPANAGSQILTVQPGKTVLAPWTGLGVLCLYAAVAVLAAALLVTRRDA